jgi:hypothetical protein
LDRQRVIRLALVATASLVLMGAGVVACSFLPQWLWLNETGTALQDFRRLNFPGAEQHFRNALFIARWTNKQALPPTLLSLGDVYMSQGKYADTKPLLDESEKIAGELYGENSIEIADVRAQQAVYYRRQADYVRADALYSRAQNIAIQAHRPDKAFEYLYARAKLALFFERADDAQPMLDQLSKLSSGSPNDKGDLLTGLADLADLRGDHAKAEKLYADAIQARQSSASSSKAGLAISFDHLAWHDIQMGKWNDAKRNAQNAVQLSEVDGLAHSHAVSATALVALARVNLHEGKITEARDNVNGSLAVCRERLGAKHPMLAGARIEQANLLSQEGKHEEAQQIVDEALKTLRTMAPESHRYIRRGRDVQDAIKRGSFVD